jgi:ribonuclease T1
VNSRRRVSAALLGLLVLVVGGWVGRHALSDPPGSAALAGDRPAAVASAAGLPGRPLSQLPPQAAAVWRLIQHGGPFPYRQDGVVFANREGRLPPRQSGFYREYTVPTPGEHDRGARRLITGGAAELYYTGDHYMSFVAVDPRR